MSRRGNRNNRRPERSRKRLDLAPMPRVGPVRANGFGRMQKRMALTMKKTHARAQGKPIAGDKASTPPPPKAHRYEVWQRGQEGQA